MLVNVYDRGVSKTLELAYASIIPNMQIFHLQRNFFRQTSRGNLPSAMGDYHWVEISDSRKRTKNIYEDREYRYILYAFDSWTKTLREAHDLVN